MHASLKKFSAYCLLGSVSALPLLAGCDAVESESDQADRKAEAAVQTGLTSLRSGQAGEASAAIRPVTSDQALSAMGKARAAGMLAEAELTSARQLLENLATVQVDATATAWKLEQLISKFGSVTELAGSYSSFEPAEPKANVQKEIQRAQGSPTAPVWFEDPAGDSDLPSLSQVNQSISQLEGQISDRRQKIAELTKQRDELNQQAQELIAKANEMNGQEAVDQFRRGTQIRQQAANASSEIDQLNHQLMPLTADLEVSQSHKKIIEEAIARYQEQSKALDEAWKTISGQQQAQGELARNLLNSTSDEMPSILTHADRLAELVEAGTGDRETVHQHLEEAISYASQAASAAETARTGLSQRATANPNSKPAFDNLRETFNSSHFKLIQLNAQHALATSLANQAALLGMQVRAAQTLDPLVRAGQMTLPPSLAQADLQVQWGTIKERAEEAFVAATELSEDIVGAPASSSEQQGTAQVLRALTEHAWAVAKRTAGEEQAAAQHVAAARTAAQAAADLKAVLPPLPAEIQPAATSSTARTGLGRTPEAANGDADTPPVEDEGEQ